MVRLDDFHAQVKLRAISGELSRSFFSELLDLYQEAFGFDPVRRRVNAHRLGESTLNHYAAFSVTDKLLASSSVYEEGKRGATAVLRRFRGEGLAAMVIKFSLDVQPSQYGETRDHAQLARLTNAGLVACCDFACLGYNLPERLVNLIEDHEMKDGLCYYRRNQLDPPFESHWYWLVHSADRALCQT